MKVQSNKAVKFSVYVKDSQLRHDIEMLAGYDNTSITELLNTALQEYRDSRIDDVAYLRREKQNRIERKAQQTQQAEASTDAQAANDDDDNGQQPEQAEATKGQHITAPQETFLSAVEIANMLKIARSNVYQLASKGVLPKGVKIGASRRWPLSEILALLDRLGISQE